MERVSSSHSYDYKLPRKQKKPLVHIVVQRNPLPWSLNSIWDHEIKPLLKEYFFDDDNEDKVQICQMLFDRVKREIEWILIYILKIVWQMMKHL